MFPNGGINSGLQAHGYTSNMAMSWPTRQLKIPTNLITVDRSEGLPEWDIGSLGVMGLGLETASNFFHRHHRPLRHHRGLTSETPIRGKLNKLIKKHILKK